MTARAQCLCKPVEHSQWPCTGLCRENIIQQFPLTNDAFMMMDWCSGQYALAVYGKSDVDSVYRLGWSTAS